jgi:hypothetical protein
MIAYMHTIINAAENTPGLALKLYDEQFRLKISQHPEMSWSTVENHLWVMCITQNNNDFAPAKEFTPYNRSPFKRGRGGFACPGGRGRGRGMAQNTPPSATSTGKRTGDYFNRGSCTRKGCTWAHLCAGCGKPHPVSQCPNK